MEEKRVERRGAKEEMEKKEVEDFRAEGSVGKRKKRHV